MDYNADLMASCRKENKGCRQKAKRCQQAAWFADPGYASTAAAPLRYGGRECPPVLPLNKLNHPLEKER